MEKDYQAIIRENKEAAAELSDLLQVVSSPLRKDVYYRLALFTGVGSPGPKTRNVICVPPI